METINFQKIKFWGCCFLAGMGWMWMGISGKAQSLSFSQVLLINNVEDTVPAGKVWKMESILTGYYFHYGGGSSCVSDIDALQVYVNGTSKYLQNGSPGSGNSTLFFGSNSFPYWLPSGTRLRTNCANSHLSVIEFNVVP